ncbi:type II secretion system protein J [Anabaena azotica]|uniref:type II secretion system protein J n=1 Tax=Anabaena azotica TaxID=197653 RepID=UPI0039A6584D
MKYLTKKIRSNFDIDQGFTLIEVIVAAAIMSVVVALAGTAFVGILQQNRKAEFESQRRTNLNRALDYIANEVRMARTIHVATPSPTPTTIPSTTIPSGTGVLRLTIPYTIGNITRTYTVVYYTSTSSNGWKNPSSINRYSNVPIPVPVTPTPTPATVTSVPSPSPNDSYFLVDGIKAPSTLPTCSSGGTRSGGNGFYACIYPDPTISPAAKKVDLYLYGTLSNASTDTRTYEVKSTVFTRTN